MFVDLISTKRGTEPEGFQINVVAFFLRNQFGRRDGINFTVDVALHETNDL